MGIQLFDFCVGVWVGGHPPPTQTYIKRCAMKFHIFWYQSYGRHRTSKKAMIEKLFEKWILRGLKLRGLIWNQISTPNYVYQNDHRNKTYKRVILRIKRSRIWAQPTQFQNQSEISKNEFPGNWTKSWISPESAWFTDSFSIFENKKIAHRKKLWRFLLPKFDLTIQNIFTIVN